MKVLLFQNATSDRIAISPFGRVAEWLNAAVLKTADAQAFVGSNPTPSAIENPGIIESARDFLLSIKYPKCILSI